MLYSNFKNHEVYTDNMYTYGVFEGTDMYFEIPSTLVGYGNPRIVNGKHKLEGKISILDENSLAYDSLLHFQVPSNKTFKSLSIKCAGGSADPPSALLGSKLIMFVVDPSAELNPNIDNLIYHAPLTREHIRELEGTELAPTIISTTGEVSSDGYVTFPLDGLKSGDEIYIAVELPYTYDAYKTMFGTTSSSTTTTLVFKDESGTNVYVGGVFGNTSNLFYFNPSKVTDDAFRIFCSINDGSQTPTGLRLGIKTKQDLATLKYDIASNKICEFGSFTQRHLSDYMYYDEHRNYVAFTNLSSSAYTTITLYSGGSIRNHAISKDNIYWCESKENLPNSPDLSLGGRWKSFAESTPQISPGQSVVIRATSSAIKLLGAGADCEISGDIRTLMNYKTLRSVVEDEEFVLGFNYCNSVTKLPDCSRITSVGYNGFARCFRNNKYITTTPDFSNVVSVGTSGFSSCFEGCSSLSKAITPNVSTWDNYKFSKWLEGTASSGIVYKPKTLEIPRDTSSGIPTDWTALGYGESESV